MRLRLSLFGAPTVMYGDESRALEFERRGQLISFLALKQSWVGRADVAHLLWPEHEQKHAYANLRKALFRLSSLPWADRIESNGNALRLSVPTDVSDFENALRARRLDEAVAIATGPLLAGFDDDANERWSNWLSFERERHRVAWRTAAQEFLSCDVNAHLGAELASRLVDDDPLDEGALALYMTWLARAGQAARARQAYRDFERRLAQEMGLVPGAELKRLHDSIGLAPLHSGRASPARPVVADDSFVGRTVELRRIGDLLADGACRLLTLIGPGGVGKTRLARRAMEEAAPRYADGALFVALEDVESARQLESSLVRALGVAPAAGADPIGAVIDHLVGRQTLLVLDNFEQLVNEADTLRRLLAACPGLKIVVTSRVRLALAEEWLQPIDGLPCPEEDDQDRLDAFDAARLFVRAAIRVSPDLVPAMEASAIVDICRQVDGLPLALELSAAWTRVLPCDAIAAELRRGVALLGTGETGRPVRHSSMELVFDQSWRLLNEVERETLARLSVLHGSFTTEAARAVTSASLPVLASLVDKSLLRRDGARLRLHPLVQQLAGARLGESEARARAVAAHAAHYLNLLEQLRGRTEEGDREALATIDNEFENCSSAWQHAVAASRTSMLRGCLPTLVDYWEHRARYDEGLLMLRAALESPLADDDPGMRAMLAGEISLLELRQSRFGEAMRHASAALADAEKLRDRDTKYRALTVLGSCAASVGRHRDAQRLHVRALKLARSGGRAQDEASALENLAIAEKRLGRYEESLRLSLEALALHRRNGDMASVALSLSNLGSMFLLLRQNDDASVHLREALTLSERGGLVSTVAFVLANLTELAMRNGDDAEARRHARRALDVAESKGMRLLAGWLLVQLARLALRENDDAEAHRALGAAASHAMELGSPYVQAALMLALAELLEARGHAGAARRLLAFAASHPEFSVPDREELRSEWRRRAADGGPGTEWTGPALADLLRRLVIEAPARHASLIALLAE